jgi:hypothetical protein
MASISNGSGRPGFQLPGDPAVLVSAVSALLEGFCAIWLAGDDEGIDTLTGLLSYGLTGPRR